jgi:hypothetical protein
MKKILFPFFSLFTVACFAQAKLVNQAIITTKTTIISPEGEGDNMPPPPPPSGGAEGGEVRVMRFMGDGETKSVTTIKGDMVKTFTETEMGRTTILRDNKNKKTTTLMEMMGNKMGFYATDEEQAQLSKQMDSMMQSRRQDGSNPLMGNTGSPVFETVTVEGSKKIAGYACKKALIIRTRPNGNKDTTVVWYNAEVKLDGLVSTGGAGGGFGGFVRNNNALGGLDKLEGFPMQYETQAGRGRKMIIEVTKLVTDKEIADKEFDIPKDFNVKPAKEMQNFGPGGGRGGFQIRMGG